MYVRGVLWRLATKVAIRLGARNPLIFAMLARRCRAYGTTLRLRDEGLEIVQGKRVVRLAPDDFHWVPSIAQSFKAYHASVIPEQQGEYLVVDYSQTRPQCYARSGLVFVISGVPEEPDAIEDYFRWYRPSLGEVVFDGGANCGVSTYYLSHCVGPTGRVYAFEPDPLTHELLLKNIAEHGLCNVVPLHFALAGTTGTATFHAEGTTASKLARSGSRHTTGNVIAVETISLTDACNRFGTPNFIKLDIEGAEVEVLEACKPFLREHPVHLAVDTNHWVHGSLTAAPVEAILQDCGYEASSSADCGFMTTWGRPRRPGL